MQEKRIQINGQNTAYLIRDDGTIFSEKRNRILKGTLKRNEYHTVYLTYKNKQYNFMVHRLVAEYFCENPNNYTIVHHKDENKYNNAANNLEWVTTERNLQMVKREYKQRMEEIKSLDDNWVELKGLKGYGANKMGQIINLTTKKILKPTDRQGYHRVFIRNKSYSVHRLVYEAFHGNCPQYLDHIDGNRSNNILENLRPITQSVNMKNSFKNGHKGQIVVQQFDKKGNLLNAYSSIQQAADAVGVTHAAVRSAIERKGTSAGFVWKKLDE